MDPVRTRVPSRLIVDVYTHGRSSREEMATEIRESLTATPRRTSPKYFYDDEGSELFEQITTLPEYYPTRAERALLERIAPELMEDVRPAEVVELGSGSSSKTRTLLRAPSARDHLRRYQPFDVSEGIVRASAQELLEEFPFLSVHGVIGDFALHLNRVPAPQGRRLVLFLGGTIGNFDPPERTQFLVGVRDALLGPDDRLLVGMDLVKNVALIEAAYNDSRGITAAFNRNVLAVLNRDLGADFDLDAFEHRAFFNTEASRIEMHLIPSVAQHVHLGACGVDITVRPTESIWTECSYKFTEASAEAALGAAGLRIERLFVNDDATERFALALAAPV